ncbi:hypothetical protein NIES3974_23970 [Calothrix sp. NIES-3974]|nr:hypothetical protein NIES3974_23970 [Calothrix sp. NIES-3974]
MTVNRQVSTFNNPTCQILQILLGLLCEWTLIDAPLTLLQSGKTAQHSSSPTDTIQDFQF